MKKTISITLMILMSICTACTTNEIGTPSIMESELQTSSQSTEEQGEPENDQGEPENDQAEQETYELLLSLYEPALNTFFWYYNDPTEDLQIVAEGDYAVDDYYREVGKFANIADMKEATEQFFTKDFCMSMFYEHAFNSDIQYPKYKEMDGKLYRNIQSGGIGWPFALTDNYELAYADDQWRVLTMNVDVFDETEWYYFVFQKEDGTWKFHHLYDYSPWRTYERTAAPLLSSPIAAYDWDQISDLDPVFLNSYYIYQFLSDVGNEYNDGNPYIVPAVEVIENFALHFDGITKDMLIEAAQHEYTSMKYDGATDAFLFNITFDPGTSLVLNTEERDGNVILQSLSIGKSGRAVRWSYLTTLETDDGLRYLSNRVEEIPEG